ncbi:SecDF P1 head subdomain-containing protein [Nitrincola alkalilacustris]|uniref:SecDF P1 head subdomain-containing protein n=1 Tax=Nitrincola alkalilacustris TaxID=1571224 RepID=UPI00124C1273|nr:hypothetical protein [Nitrincola alkalilacustris]
MKWIAILLLTVSVAVKAETELAFQLCSSYIQQSEVGALSEEGRWPAYIKLTELGTSSFGEYTAANVGNKIRLIVDGQEFTRAVIVVPVNTGNIWGQFDTKEEAMRWQDVLTGGLSADPCGPSSN